MPSHLTTNHHKPIDNCSNLVFCAKMISSLEHCFHVTEFEPLSVENRNMWSFGSILPNAILSFSLILKEKKHDNKFLPSFLPSVSYLHFTPSIYADTIRTEPLFLPLSSPILITNPLNWTLICLQQDYTFVTCINLGDTIEEICF